MSDDLLRLTVFRCGHWGAFCPYHSQLAELNHVRKLRRADTCCLMCGASKHSVEQYCCIHQGLRNSNCDWEGPIS